MSTYAILGATGRVGGQVLDQLVAKRAGNIRALVRSKSKLEGAHDDLTNVEITEGNVFDVDTLQKVASGTKAIFVSIGPNGNKPGTTLNQDCLKALIQAMQQIRQQETAAKLPRIVFLSSASIIDHLCKEMPHLVHQLLLTAVSYNYADLRAAEELLRNERSWLPYTCVNPGGLSEDSAKGHKLSTEKQQTPIAIADLAAGMIEVADSRGDELDAKNVSVLSDSKPSFPYHQIPLNLTRGLLCHFFPFLYPYLN